MELPVEILSVFFEVMDDFLLFSKLSVLSKEANRYSQLHKKSFADRMSRDGLLPNGTKHGLIVRETQELIEEVCESERWEYGKLIMRLIEETSDIGTPPDYSTDLKVYNSDGQLVYRLRDSHNGADYVTRYIETIGEKYRVVNGQPGEGWLRFKQPYEVAIRPIEL